MSVAPVGLTPALVSPIPSSWFTLTPVTGNGSTLAFDGVVPNGTYDLVIETGDKLCGSIGHRSSVTIRVGKNP